MGNRIEKDSSTVIGTFTGKCCDSNVVNSNGQYLSRELFDNLIESDDYKNAMQNRYYIGYLGHPEDPNCMDFKNACIIMTDMEMDDDGEIFGTFDLVDTPVGRIVKAFIDAGVNFGISIRGAGDVDRDGTVDPDTFIFRGFDIVTFPAYSDCVPDFKQIAASEDMESKKKYKKVCSVIQREASKITSSEAIDVIQEQLNENSDEYKKLEDAKFELACDSDIDMDSIANERMDALMNLYIEQVKVNKKLLEDCKDLSLQLCEIKRSASRTQSLVDSQIYEMDEEYKELEEVLESTRAKYKDQVRANKDLKRELSAVTAKLDSAKRDKVLAYEELDKLNNAISSIKDENLNYSKKIESSEDIIHSQDAEIAALRSELKTVNSSKRTADLEASNRECDLQRKLEESEDLIFSYQQAYADMCANAVGVTLDNVPITSSTSVDELRRYIYGSSSVSSASSNGIDPELDAIEISDDEDADLIVL